LLGAIYVHRNEPMLILLAYIDMGW
jgi:hypothetical protein